MYIYIALYDLFYKVSNPLSAICNNDDYNRSTRLLAATTLRYSQEGSSISRQNPSPSLYTILSSTWFFIVKQDFLIIILCPWV